MGFVTTPPPYPGRPSSERVSRRRRGVRRNERRMCASKGFSMNGRREMDRRGGKAQKRRGEAEGSPHGGAAGLAGCRLSLSERKTCRKPEEKS